MSVAAVLDALSRLQQRHPLVLFLLLGGVLLLAEGLQQPPPLPSASEAGAADAARQWLEEEVLYREAVSRGLGDGDLIVRRRLVQKMRQLLETGVEVSAPDETTLQAWIDAQPERYGEPQRLHLDHVFLSRGRHGEELETAAAAIREALTAPTPRDWRTLSDPHPAGTRLENVTALTLEGLFGSTLAAEIAALPPGDWQAPLASAQGLHLLRIRQRQTLAADAASQRQRAQRDWLLAQRQSATRAAVEDLMERYGAPGS